MDWKSLIEDIRQRGYSYVEIGNAVGRTGAGISAMVHNEKIDPAWGVGQQLIDIHKRVCKQPRLKKIELVA